MEVTVFLQCQKWVYLTSLPISGHCDKLRPKANRGRRNLIDRHFQSQPIEKSQDKNLGQ